MLMLIKPLLRGRDLFVDLQRFRSEPNVLKDVVHPKEEAITGAETELAKTRGAA